MFDIWTYLLSLSFCLCTGKQSHHSTLTILTWFGQSLRPPRPSRGNKRYHLWQPKLQDIMCNKGGSEWLPLHKKKPIGEVCCHTHTLKYYNDTVAYALGQHQVTLYVANSWSSMRVSNRCGYLVGELLIPVLQAIRLETICHININSLEYVCVTTFSSGSSSSFIIRTSIITRNI